jgi:hypothetical protein
VSHFVVSFMKDVLGGNGREIEVCQGTLDIDASDESEATELAKRRFCETQSLCDWSLHADRIEVKSGEVSARETRSSPGQISAKTARRLRAGGFPP